VNNFQALVEAAAAAPKQTAKGNTDGDPLLEDFVLWLQTEDPAGVKTENTARSYKSYMVQADKLFGQGKVWADLSTDQRSGVKAFGRYIAQVNEAAALLESTDEDTITDADEILLEGLAAEDQD
jgi:hypothetical protein